jgi:hypothetical protein
VPVAPVGAADDRGALDAGDDVEAVDGAADDPASPVAVDSAGALLLGVAGVVVGVDGVDGELARCEEALVSSPSVVVPESDELPTSADTGFWPMSSMPVTMPMATANKDATTAEDTAARALAATCTGLSDVRFGCSAGSEGRTVVSVRGEDMGSGGWARTRGRSGSAPTLCPRLRAHAAGAGARPHLSGA